MNQAQKKKVAVFGGLGILFFAMLGRSKEAGRGTVRIGPVDYQNVQLSLDKETEELVRRFTLALPEFKRAVGADPNTLVSRQPSPSEIAFANELIAVGRELSTRTDAVPYPSGLEKMLALAVRLPGDTLQRTNAELYALLGVNVAEGTPPTVPLTPAREVKARELVARWRPYSQDAVDTLFVLVDEARELARVNS